jgi:hypothetical protein
MNKLYMDELIQEIDNLEKKLANKRQELKELRKSCTHVWSEISYCQEEDIDSPYWRSWQRTCDCCDLKQSANNTLKLRIDSIIPGCIDEQEVPNFR